MEQNPERDPVGIDLDGIWVTRSISKVIRFIQRPLCDHLEVNIGDDWPMAYVLSEDGLQTLESYNWPVDTYEEASEEMKEFIVELHLENQVAELLRWHTDNP